MTDGPRFFDYVRCSMDVGHLTNLTLETESLRSAMDRYWVSPAGQLFVMNCDGTHDFLIITESDPGYDYKYNWRNLDIVPNGCHGSVSPVYFTGTMDLTASVLDNVQGEQHLTLVFTDGQCTS